MANEEHLRILERGMRLWNRWREESPDIRPDLSGADLSRAELSRAHFREADLRDVDLSRADLSQAKLNGAKLNGARLNGANLSGAELSRANLSGAELNGVNLSGANLRGADLNGAELNRANLRGACLSGADLGGAELKGAELSGAELSGAELSRADLDGADLDGADLSEAELSMAVAGHTMFADLDLSVVKGLETVRHIRPSTIGIDTIYRSGGKIPAAFLRGVGAPDAFIAYVASLTGEAIQYYSCFISYSSKDDTFAQRLHADLQQNNVRCWFAPEDMKIGNTIRLHIDESIRIHNKLLLVLSEHSVASQWVEHEVEHALDLENKWETPILFPIRLDEAVMESKVGWAGNVRRTRNIGDFCRWKDHDSYQQAFIRLLRDLKASEA
jgi:uncharacterized protein YjbI with pentapeptide repeats